MTFPSSVYPWFSLLFIPCFWVWSIAPAKRCPCQSSSPLILLDAPSFCHVRCDMFLRGSFQVKAGPLPDHEQDTKYQYLWNCREYLDGLSKIVIATDADAPGQVRHGERCLGLNVLEQ